MDQQDFKRTMKEFLTMGRAVLKGYRLGFTSYSESRAGGVADIIQSNSDHTEGVLYCIPLELLPELDFREGVHVGKYERIEVPVLHYGKTINAWTYQIVDKSEVEIAPSIHYLQLMLNGMKAYCTSKYREAFMQRIKNQFNINLSN